MNSLNFVRRVLMALACATTLLGCASDPASSTPRQYLASPARKDIRIYSTYPKSGVIDYSKPSYVIRGDQIYSTYPKSGIIDYSKPSYRISK